MRVAETGIARRTAKPRASARLGAVAAAALLIAGTACGDGGGGPEGDTIIVGMRSDFSGFNPVTNSSLYTNEVINYALFTPLVQYDAELAVRPYLVESWEEQADTAVVLRLRHDVSWHDGRPVTAEDVKFTFDLAKDTVTGSLLGSAFLADVGSAEVIDSFTIRFRFERPHAQALEDFWWAPLPKHLLEGVAPAEMRNAPYNRAPVGSGPFRFTEWRANERLVLERNPAFPEALGGPPAAARVVFRIIPEASTMLTELVTGGVHVDIPVLPDQVEQIQENENLELYAFPGRTVYYIGWNNERPPFDDARVRRALALAIDRREVIDALLSGQGELAESTIPPWHPIHSADIEPLQRDTAAAARLLAEAGWSDRDGNGIRENAEGRPLRFTMLTSDDALRRAVVEVLQSQLQRIGVDVQVRVTEFQTMLDQHRTRDFDAVFTNWVLDNFQVASSPFALFHSSQADVPLSANRSGVRSTELDQLIERGGAATEPEAQRQAWRDFTLLLQRDQPVTFMFWLNEMAASNVTVQNVIMDQRGELLSIAEWTLGGR
ncbi:MAG: ABC transporter substrate-binding protein [Longimicrobiales bacterium]